MEHLSGLGLYADVDNSAETLKKKIRNGEIAQYNFIIGALSTLNIQWWHNVRVYKEHGFFGGRVLSL